MNRRSFLRGSLAGLGAAATTAALSPLIKVKRAHAAGNGKRIIIVGIGGGLRLRESLGMAEGATMPNLFGTVPLISGFGDSAPPLQTAASGSSSSGSAAGCGCASRSAWPRARRC